MTNNLIRKSVAVLSSALLTGAALVGFAAPAQAAGELKLEAAAGVGYKVVHGANFELKTSVTAGNDSAELQYLHYKITTTSDINVYADTDNASTTVTDAAGELEVADTAASGTFPAKGYTSNDTVSFIDLLIEDASDNAFAATASDQTITVLAFIDKNDDNIANDGEWQASQTITWVDDANYDFTGVLTQPKVGDNTATLTVTSPSINLSESSGKLIVDWSEGITTWNGSTEDNDTGSYDPDSDGTNKLAFVSGTGLSGGSSNTIATSDAGVISANLEYDAGTDIDILTSSRTVTATSVANLQVTLAAGAGNTALAASSGAVTAASGSGSFDVKIEVEDSSNLPITTSTHTVSVKIEEDSIANFGSGASVTAGGLTLTNANSASKDKIEFDLTTDAAAAVTFTVSYSGMKAGEDFNITASVLGVADLEFGSSDTAITNDDVSVTIADEAATTLYSADVVATDQEVVFATDSAFTLTYHVMNQFGGLFSGTGNTVVVTVAGDAYTGAVSGGVAQVNFAGFDADNDGKLALNADVIAVGTDPSVDAVATEIFVGAPKAVASIAVAGSYGSSSNKLDLNTDSTGSADVRFGQSTTAPSTEIADATFTLRDSDGNATRGQVTLSSPNLIFQADNGANTVYSKGSVTVWTDENGVADIGISSQVAGAQVITITSGSVSTTKTAYFSDAATTAGTSLTVDTAANVAPGSTATVIATLTDKFGNPVNTVAASAMISVAYTGPGLVYPSTSPVETDSNGQVKIQVLLGTADTGTGSVTVSYDQSDDGDFTGTATGDLDLNTTASFTIGSSYGDMTAWTKDMGDGTAKVYVKFPTVGEKVRIGHQTGGSGSYDTIFVKTIASESDSALVVNANGSYIVRTIDLADGTNRIRVTVGDSTEVQVRYNQ